VALSLPLPFGFHSLETDLRAEKEQRNTALARAVDEDAEEPRVLLEMEKTSACTCRKASNRLLSNLRIYGLSLNDRGCVQTSY
jgi:hypothetical protein